MPLIHGCLVITNESFSRFNRRGATDYRTVVKMSQHWRSPNAFTVAMNRTFLCFFSSGGGRKRHRFPKADDLPSFRDFQLRYQFRSMFRKYLRLAKDSNDLVVQIQQEFRKPGMLDDRAISEANRRYKELQNVLNTSVGGGTAAPTDWPWTKKRTKPQAFPRKTGL